MNIEDEIAEIRTDLKSVAEKVTVLAVDLGKISAENKLAPLLIKWLCFPLVTILAAAYGVSNLIKVG